MRGRSLVLLALVAVLAAACVGAVQVERRHHLRRHTSPPPPPRFLEELLGGEDEDVDEDEEQYDGGYGHAGSSPRFQAVRDYAAPPSQADQGIDFVDTVYNLLAKSRDNSMAESSAIEKKKMETVKMQEELAQKQREIQQRQELLTRLQFCLAQEGQTGAAQRAGEAAKAAGAAAGAASNGGNSNDDPRKTRDELNQLRTELQKKLDQVAARERDLDSREASIRQQEGNMKDAQLTIKRQAEQINVVEQKLQNQVANGGPSANGSDSAPMCVSAEACGAKTSCGECTSNSKCGWCGATNKCVDVVNGNTTECPMRTLSWQYCKGESCEERRSCSSCMADPDCGFCASTGKCMSGRLTGPRSGECPNWYFASKTRFLSLNIYGRDQQDCSKRAAEIFLLIKEANADYVALQEVEDWFLESLAKQDWARNYHASDFGSGHAPGGLLILSKVPLASVAYYEKTQPGQVQVDQRGRVLVVRPKLGLGNFAVATTTLDWRSGENRADSLEYIFSVLNITSDVVLSGDLNFDYGAQPETSRVPASYADVWMTLRSSQSGFTWDPAHNSYAKKADPTSSPSRIDRILVKSSSWQAHKIDKVGAPDISPHYGLLADLQLNSATC